MIELSVYYGDKKSATIYRVKSDLQFMVVCKDEEEDFTRTEFFYSEQQAEVFAEEWIDE